MAKSESDTSAPIGTLSKHAVRDPICGRFARESLTHLGCRPLGTGTGGSSADLIRPFSAMSRTGLAKFADASNPPPKH